MATANVIQFPKSANPIAQPIKRRGKAVNVRDPILDDLDALPRHEAEIWRIRIRAAAELRRIDIEANNGSCSN